MDGGGEVKKTNKVKAIMQTEWFRIRLVFRVDPGMAAFDCAAFSFILACTKRNSKLSNMQAAMVGGGSIWRPPPLAANRL